MQSLGEFCCSCRGPGSSLPGPPQIQAANHMPNVESEHSRSLLLCHPTGLSFCSSFLAVGNSDHHLIHLVLTSFISLREEPRLPLCSRKICSNDKPWFPAHLRRLRSEREVARRSGDVDRFRQPKYRFAKAVREAKKHSFEEKPLCVTEREVVRLPPLPS